MTDVFLSGGAGDVFAIVSHLSPEEKLQLRRIYWATRATAELMPLMKLMPDFPNLKEQTSLWDDFGKLFCFHHIDMFEQITGAKVPTGCKDWSICHVFRDIDEGRRTFGGCPFLNRSVADISGFELPQAYDVVVPTTPSNFQRHRSLRDFNVLDWDRTLRRLRSRELQGVVVNSGNDRVPTDNRLVNLTGQTSLAQAIEILKDPRCQGYSGIDSCLATLACQRFGADDLRILSRHDHYYRWRVAYCAPHRSFPFVADSI